MKISIPTKARVMNLKEYQIVQRVFGDTLPFRWRIIITNGAGENGRPFVIPTSLLTSILGTAVAGGFLGVIGGYISSWANLAYIVNVGSRYPDMSHLNDDVLVHETAHVWQGKNSKMALSYVFNSCLNQCLSGKGAYKYKLGEEWSSYNAEQQASIVEDWFMTGEWEQGELWDYVKNHVRKGDA